MYITLNNNHFQIRLNKNKTAIYIQSRLEDSYILSVPQDLKEDELIIYLKLNTKKLIRAYEKKISHISTKSIYIYNQEFIYKWKPNLLLSYKKNKVIYSSISIKSTSNVNKIRKEVLLMDIKTSISLWEERLNCIIDNIYLKNYKTKSYNICPKDSTIEFSNYLINKSFSYMEFIVAKASLDYLNIEADKQEQLMHEFVNDWKHCAKIYEYERCNPH